MTDLEALPAPALEIDPGGTVVSVNELAVRLFDRSRSRLLGVQAGALPGIPDGDPDDPAPGEAVLESGNRLRIYSEGGLKSRLETKVLHLSRLASVGRLVTTVVHELNNALSGILGYSQLLLDRDLDEDVQRDLSRVHQEAQRTSRVVQNLLRFSRQGECELQQVHLVDLIKRCAELKQRSFALRSIRFEVKAPRRLEEVHIDEALLFQVFVNLFTNAEHSIRAVRNEGNLTVSVRRARSVVQVDIQDDGPGVPEELCERIFDPFFTTRKAGEGTGLGLALCRQILAQHGGQIELVNRRRAGACFRVSLPLGEGKAPLRPRETATTGSRLQPIRNRRIVVVEDEPAVRELVGRAFAGQGNHLITFDRGEDALSFLQNERVDLVISDIHRPGMDGIQLYEQVRSLRPFLKKRFLFVTGDTISHETTRFLKRTRVPYVKKPLAIEDLLLAAQELLEKPEDQGELFASR